MLYALAFHTTCTRLGEIMSRYVSFLIASWRDKDSHAMRWQISRTRDEEPIHLPDASFVLRIWTDADGQMVRGLIRHVPSGQEMQFQSGERVFEFIRAWMENAQPPPSDCVPDERGGWPERGDSLACSKINGSEGPGNG